MPTMEEKNFNITSLSQNLGQRSTHHAQSVDQDIHIGSSRE
jgi:hypothetical protein